MNIVRKYQFKLHRKLASGEYLKDFDELTKPGIVFFVLVFKEMFPKMKNFLKVTEIFLFQALSHIHCSKLES